MPIYARSIFASVFILTITNLAPGAAVAQSGATYEGRPVRIADGTAHTVVRTNSEGRLTAISVVFTPELLENLPVPAAHEQMPDFAYVLPMPTTGSKTFVNHVVINWNPAGHPPPHIYEVPHFDFHFYFVGEAERNNVSFASAAESGEPAQQPPGELMPAGYVIPPGTAVPQMGVHAVNLSAPEFQHQPFTATLI